MSDKCYFNVEGYCILESQLPDCPDCEFNIMGKCTATDDDLLTEEEWLGIEDE